MLCKNVNRPQSLWPVSLDNLHHTRQAAGHASPLLMDRLRQQKVLTVLTCRPLWWSRGRDAPESVRRIAQAGKLCVMFYGPAANKVILASSHSFAYASQESARAMCTALGPFSDAGHVSFRCLLEVSARELKLGLVLAQKC